MFEPAPTAVSIAGLPWNVIDGIVSFVDAIATLGRLASMHSAFATALEYDPLWENICRTRYPPIYQRFRSRFVDSWRLVLRRESTSARIRSVSEIVAAGNVDTASQLTVRRCVDLSFQTWWSLGSVGICRLATVLAGGSSLGSLNLAGQSLTTGDLEAVITIARNAPSLATLVLDENRFRGRETGDRLARLVAHSPRLTCLSLARCAGVDEEALGRLCAPLQSSHIVSMSLDGTQCKGAFGPLLRVMTAQFVRCKPAIGRLSSRDAGVKVSASVLASSRDSVRAMGPGRRQFIVDVSKFDPAVKFPNKARIEAIGSALGLSASASQGNAKTCTFSDGAWKATVSESDSDGCCVA